MAKVYEKADERILGNGDFVESVLKSAEEKMKNKYDLLARGLDLTDVAFRVAEAMGIEQDKVWVAGQEPGDCSGTESFMLLGGKKAGCNYDIACPPVGSISNSRGEICDSRGEARKG